MTDELVALTTYHKPTDTGDWRRHPISRLDLAIAAVILLTAMLVRTPFILRGETLLHSDEAIVGLMAQDIAAGERFPIYFYGQRYMGALEAYVIAGFSFLFEDPIHALRFGPTCFLALLAVVQYLMLTRWFGRSGGLLGALVLLASAPVFTQWSVSARGGYIEILLWGSALLWAYTEWFVPPLPQRGRSAQRFAFGVLVGSGLWINPTIVVFVLPIIAHALLSRPLAAILREPAVGRGGATLRRVVRATGVMTLPALVVLAILALNAAWAVWVADGKVHHQLLLGLLPEPIAAVLLGSAAVAVAIFAALRTRLFSRARNLLRTNGLMIAGALIGATPAALYAVQAALGLRCMDSSVPLGFKPLWMAGDAMHYLIRGLPLLLAADVRPYLQLVTVGRASPVSLLNIETSAAVIAANWLVLGALLTSLIVFISQYRGQLADMLSLRARRHPPALLLVLGLCGMMALYVIGSCSFNFTTIRYLVPLWAFLPGLLAAVFVSRKFRFAARVAPLCACIAWGGGQIAMYSQLGRPHPLRALANAVTARGIDPACAEILDAHLLSYLTGQRCRVDEFDPFWPRLTHYRPLLAG
ncbi:MAG: glycosyltransferase family 39 protein, partial [Planctomycetota bacterium]